MSSQNAPGDGRVGVASKLGMGLLPMKLLLKLLAKIGLSSCKKLITLGSNAGGVKSAGEIGASEEGTGDKIPGKEAVRSRVGPPAISHRSKTPGCALASLTRGDADAAADLSKEAMRAAGEIAPDAGRGGGSGGGLAAEELGPVSRWTRVMNSLGLMWMILGDTV